MRARAATTRKIAAEVPVPNPRRRRIVARAWAPTAWAASGKK
jgi:hypothetical protein